MRWWTGRRQPWDEVTYMALDLETTGLDPHRDRILSVGMVPLSGGLIRWGDRRYTLVLSLIHISEPTRLKTRSRMPSSA